MLAQFLILYAILAWGGTGQAGMIRLERAQKGILKVLSYKSQWYNTAALYRKYGVLSARQLFILQVIM